MEEKDVLRILTLIICFMPALCQAEKTEYKEPDNEAIKRAKAATQSVFDQADAMVKNSEFLKDLKTQKQSINAIPDGVKPSLYDLKGIDPQIREDGIISKALAAGEQIQNHSAEPWTNAPIILVSLSMPDSQLKSLMSEASKVGSAIVLRGALDNDLNKTIGRIQEIAGKEQSGGFRIDPTLFSRFNVTAVPAFILPLEPVKTCDQNGCEVPKHVSAYGTASLLYFLEKASRLGNEEEKAAADNWLNIYKEDNNDNS
jgi:type-F conjugative transfer system pilin assembly protein TrbC